MRQTSALYKSIRQQPGYHYNVNVICNTTQTTYGMNKLKSVHIKPMLFPENGPSIGNACSTECDIVLIEDSENWPRMAEFEVKVQIMSENNTQVSEWLTMGTFYTDERAYTVTGDLSVIGFDKMLETEQTWADKITPPSSWPITAKAWCDLIEDAGLFEFDTRNSIDNTIAFVGLNTLSTVRDKLKDIAAAHGGNWNVTPEGKLRLVPFTNVTTGNSAIAGIAIVGLAIVGLEESTLNNYQDIGTEMRSFSCSTPLSAISGAYLETDGGASSSAGNSSGYVIQGVCNFSNSNGVAALCLSKVTGYVYHGFDAITAYLDPACELGDLILFDEVAYQMMTITWNINHRPTADISAPYEEEVDHEYTVISEGTKTFRKVENVLLDYPTTAQMSSAIEQTAEFIKLDVAESYYNKDEINDIQQQNEASFTLTSQQIQAAFNQITSLNGELEEINYYIRYEIIGGVGTVIVGQTNSLAELHITNGQISMIYNGELVSYWNQNQQYTPKKLEIPLGGSLKLGNIQWQPRSSGNLSVFLINS